MKFGSTYSEFHMKKQLRKYHLSRELGLLSVTLSGVGIIFGAGIYALIGKGALLAGNAVWLSFVLGAVFAIFTGLSYAELSSMLPKAGAEYVYVENAFGRKLAFVIGWLIIVSGVIAGATVSLGFAGYFSALFKTPLVSTAIGLIIALTLLNLYGIKQTTEYAIISTLIETAGLLLIIAIGLPHITSVNLFEMPNGIPGIFSAAALIFFAYIGFEDIVRLSEETKNPTVTIPRALILAIAISTVVYILVSLAAVGSIGWQALGASSAPLASVAYSVLGKNAFFLLAIIALFATSNTVLLFLAATSRLIYGMANEKSIPQIFSAVHKTCKTPYIAIIVAGIFAILFCFSAKIELVASITDFAVFVTFAFINACVIYLRYKWSAVRRPFKVPLNIGKFPLLPLLGIIVSILMLASFGFWVIFFGLITIGSGFLVFELLERKNI